MTQRPDTSQLSQYQYDPRSRRYRNRTSGQYLSAKDVRSAVDGIIDVESGKMRDLAQSLVDGKIALSDWQVQAASLLKSLHVALGLSANGGLNNTSNADLGYIGSLIKEQYKFLREFALDIRSGKQALNGTLIARSELYTQAARSTYENVVARSATNGGATQEISILGIADHCDDCVREAAKKWSPIGSLIPIGQRVCKARCHCLMQYR